MDDPDEIVGAVVYEGLDEDRGLIGLVLTNVPACIFDGKVGAGICMTPFQARRLARTLLAMAENAE